MKEIFQGRIRLKIVNLKLNKEDDKYFLDIDLDRGDVIIRITRILLCTEDLDDVEINNESNYGFYRTWISGLFSHSLRVYGDISIIQKAKEMTLEEIEKELGYPIKIVEEKE